MRSALFSLALVAAAALRPAQAKCSWQQTGPGVKGLKIYDTPIEPEKLRLTNPCPMFTEGCCTLYSRVQMVAGFEVIDSEFGNVNLGGCPACGHNLKRMLCEMNCSPEQASFTSNLAVATIANPVSAEPKQLTVIQGDLTFDKDWSCEMYGSCNATTTVKQTASMSSCSGMLSFVVGPTASLGGVFMTPKWRERGDNTTAVLDTPLETCCNWQNTWEDPSAGNSSCPCSACAQMCPGAGGCDGRNGTNANYFQGVGDWTLSALHGFDWPVVVGTYTAIAAIAAITAVVRCQSGSA